MHSSNQVAQQIAEKLLTIKAIQLNVQTPFTWASGLRAPIYCDNRKALAYPKARTFIKEALVTLVKKKFSKVEGIAGVATAGIPQGALVAESLQLPFLYVRNKAKTHGLENSIEGQLQKKQKLVVLEDLISTGESALNACKALQIAKAQILGVVAIFSYGFKAAQKNFQKTNIPLFCLSNYDSLIKAAQQKGYIDDATLQLLATWRKDPENWKK